LFEKRLAYQAAYAATNYRLLVQLARAHGTTLASHDDTTFEHVSDAVRSDEGLPSNDRFDPRKRTWRLHLAMSQKCQKRPAPSCAPSLQRRR
jgi:hypothetical protein